MSVRSSHIIVVLLTAASLVSILIELTACEKHDEEETAMRRARVVRTSVGDHHHQNNKLNVNNIQPSVFDYAHSNQNYVNYVTYSGWTKLI